MNIYIYIYIYMYVYMYIQWNLYYETGEVLLKNTHAFSFTSISLYKIMFIIAVMRDHLS